MKRIPSKPSFSKKNKTSVTIPESKKNSRVLKANSCVKINSQHTDLQHTLPSKQLSKPQLYPLSQKLLAKNNTHFDPHQIHLIDKPSRMSYKETVRTNRGKSSIETVDKDETMEELRRTRARNQELERENCTLKERCCELQELSTKDKEKIKNLIIRINQVKNSKSSSKTMHPSTSQLQTYQPGSTTKSYSQLVVPRKLQTPYKAVGVCENQECMERKKYLQSELYQERVERDRLEGERREWERNREVLKNQYNQLLMEIREIRNDE